MAHSIVETAETAAWNSLLQQSGDFLRVTPSDGEVSGTFDMQAVVRAVLHAIRDPSDPMVNAAVKKAEKIGLRDHVGIYAAMIDAALGGE